MQIKDNQLKIQRLEYLYLDTFLANNHPRLYYLLDGVTELQNPADYQSFFFFFWVQVQIKHRNQCRQKPMPVLTTLTDYPNDATTLSRYLYVQRDLSS